MNSQTPAALTLGPGGNNSFYDEIASKSIPGARKGPEPSRPFPPMF